MKSRAYTILILGNGARILRRFHISHRALVGATAGALCLGAAGALSSLVVPPLATAWLDLHSRLDRLEVQNRTLVEERERVETRAAELSDRLARFESDALRLAALAETLGVVAPARRAGGPAPAETAPVAAGVAVRLDNLERRSADLQREMGQIEALLLSRAHQLSTLPHLAPADGPISDGFGWRLDPFTGREEFHQGVDIQADWGAPVRAPAGGVILSCGYAAGYGLSVFVEHPSGFETRYAHLSAVTVREGQRVAPGQLLGRVGSSGRASGPHLHYEVLAGERRLNPARFLDTRSLGSLLRAPA